MSEFGKGLCYNLGLFLAHAERKIGYKDDTDCSFWFNGAGDHLFDLEIPEDFPEDLKKRLTEFRNRILGYRIVFHLPIEEKNKALQEAKDFLREIDTFHEIKTEKGEWE